MYLYFSLGDVMYGEGTGVCPEVHVEFRRLRGDGPAVARTYTYYCTRPGLVFTSRCLQSCKGVVGG